ncbi:MAG: hypothetical protein GW946_01130, partial [Candidatus Pacebacteria bacterium]|nr:hypothetical protein [Candidatus Paceibacterota bacterium]
MYTYFFQLGTTTELSLAELACVLGDKKLDILTQQIIAVNSATKIDVQGLQNQLGGCVKILKKEALLNDTTAQTIATSIAQIIPEGKITFAFTQLDLRAGETSDEILLDAAEIKKELVQQGRSVRF